MIADPPRITEIELQPVHSKGELVVDNWWQPETAAAHEPMHRRFGLEFLTLVLPLTLTLLYLLVIAAPRYISESEFMVRTLGNSDAGNLASLLTDQKVTRASDETYAAAEYLASRDAVDALVQNDNLKAFLSRAEGDFLNRFPNFYRRNTREQLHKHFQNFVDLQVNTESGIAQLRAIAFTPQDALALNKAMLRNAEVFVNRLNNRIFHDSLELAERDVEAQKEKFSAVETRLANFRNRENVVDPNKEVADVLSRIGALMTKLSRVESELSQATTMAPRGPQLVTLTSEVAALRDQIASERLRMIGQKDSLASKFAEYDRIMLDRTLASKQLEASLAQYDKARHDVSRQHFYLQTVVEPEAPDQALLPNRLFSFMAAAALCLAIYSILRAVLKNIREHVT